MKLKKPIIAVPLGLAKLFRKEAYGDATPIHNIVECDPTHPGLCEEDMAALRGDYDEEDMADEPQAAAPQAKQKPSHLRLVVSNDF